MASVRILITGFGPFQGFPHNASEELVGRVKHCPLEPGIDLFSRVIPVYWENAKTVALSAVADTRPHAVLHFGISKRALGFEVERCARNHRCPDSSIADAEFGDEPLIPAGKAILHSTLPVASLVKCLEDHGYAAKISEDAGRYLCNAVYYWSLAAAGPDGPRIVFIHIPPIGSGIENAQLTMEDAVAGANILIHASVAAVLGG